jgi:uncharacterized protein YjbI with pentapeptide repeats
MNKLLQNIIDNFNDGLVETRNLQISNENFFTETIHDQNLDSSCFKNLSFFEKCLFKNCIFDSVSFQDAGFENCSLINCQIKNCNLIRIDFTETTFDKSCFEKVEQGCLVKGWFELCEFIDTNFKGFAGMPITQTAVVDSKFSKFNKSIEFKG